MYLIIKKSRGDNTPKNFPIQILLRTLKRVLKISPIKSQKDNY